MSVFTSIDLSNIPAPDVVEALSFETIFAEMLADLQGRDTAFDALVESDPAFKILEVAAYRELLIRQRINDAARAVMLAYAGGADLENLAALFGVVRLVIDPGDPDALPPVPPTYETDTELRRRTQLVLEGFSTAGPEGAYIFHSLRVPAVKDAAVSSPVPGDVVVTLLGREGDGTPDAETIAAVEAILQDEDVRPLTDNVTVQAATIVNYAVEAELVVFAGPDHAVVLDAAQAAIEAYVAQQGIGRDITLSGIYAALHQSGVERVNLTLPVANITIDDDEAGFCTAITLSTTPAT